MDHTNGKVPDNNKVQTRSDQKPNSKT